MKDPRTKAQRALTEICSILEYLEDRGELEHISQVETKARYLHPAPALDEVIVRIGKTRVRITAETLTP